MNDIEHLEYLYSIPQFTQKSEEWLNQRRGKLTSSDAATALGLNPYKTKDELVLEKCGAGRSFFGNEATKHGELYEDEAIEIYCKLMGKENHNFGMIGFKDLDPVREKRESSKKYIHDRYYFLGGSIDGVALDLNNQEGLVGLEAKCPFRRKIKHGEIPEHYLPQVHLNMFIYDLHIMDYIEYKPHPREFNIVRTHRDDAWLEENLPKLEEVWNEILHWRTQDIKTHPAYSKYYKE